MTTISIRPIGQEAPVLTGELAGENWLYRFIQLAPNTSAPPFNKEQWELVPVPFVFPVETGYYRERYDNGTLGRIWVLDDEGLWDAPEGDSAEFGRWPLYRLYTLSDAAEIIAEWLGEEARHLSAAAIRREFVDGAK